MHLVQIEIFCSQGKRKYNYVEGFSQVNFGTDFDRGYDLFMIKVGNDPVSLS